MGSNGEERLCHRAITLMKRYLVLLAILYLAFLPLGLYSGDNSPFDRALRALRSQDYKATIIICLAELEYTPENYDLNFILAQAYAFSGEWEKALNLLQKMAGLYAGNTDVLLLEARIKSWEKKYLESLARYEEILKLSPDNEEALIGTAEIAAWQGRSGQAEAIYQRILERDSKNPEIYYHLGILYQGVGNYSKAIENLQRAIELEPDNRDYRAALTRARPRFLEKFEIRYHHKIENFNDQRDDFQSDQFSLHLNWPQSPGPLILKFNHTQQLHITDVQYGIEFYPRLWSKAYGYLDFNYSPRAVCYPRSSYLLELYQGFFSSAETSLGVWRMNFGSKPVTVYLGSLGCYLGNYYPFLRCYYGSGDSDHSFSWILNLRRYFSRENYLYVGYGQGSRPFEILTIEDLLFEQARIVISGVVWYFAKKIRVEVHFSRISDKRLNRKILLAAAGYRW